LGYELNLLFGLTSEIADNVIIDR